MIYFISTLHAHHFFEHFKRNNESINKVSNKEYCAYVYIKELPYPIYEDNDRELFKEFFEQYTVILKEGLPNDVKKYITHDLYTK